MPAYVEKVNTLLALGALLMQVSIALIILGIIFYHKRHHHLLSFFKMYIREFGFAIAFISMLLSLFYSDIVGFPPCELCIIQRIFIYPQVLLFGYGMYKREKDLINFSAVLALLGACVSAYHVYIENGGSSSLACASDSLTAVTCSARYIYEFGYVTMPVMALTTQVFILVLILNYKFLMKK